MAAKLEWRAHRLMLARIVVGEVVDVTNMSPRAWRFTVGEARRADDLSAPYESLLDCKQDCEAEVRRLLKEAGVTLAD